MAPISARAHATQLWCRLTRARLVRHTSVDLRGLYSVIVRLLIFGLYSVTRGSRARGASRIWILAERAGVWQIMYHPVFRVSLSGESVLGRPRQVPFFIG